jgi:hypothetical protein
VAVLVTVTSLVAGAVGGRWTLDVMLGGSYQFPDSIGGVERTHVADAADLPLIGGLGLEGEVGIYGPGVAPEFALVVIEVPPGTDMNAAWERIQTWSDPAAGRRTRKTLGPSQFTCTPNPLQPMSGSCMWVDQHRIVELDALSQSAEELRPLALTVQAETI